MRDANLELGQRTVKVEDSVALLQLLALLLRGRQDHREVRTVDLEEDRVLAANLVLESCAVHQLVVLVVGVVVLQHTSVVAVRPCSGGNCSCSTHTPIIQSVCSSGLDSLPVIAMGTVLEQDV